MGIRRTASSALFVSVLTFSGAADAALGAGTASDPIVVDAFPFAIRGDTRYAASRGLESYACAPGTSEKGPENIYRFRLPKPAKVTAWVLGDGNGVDVDVHILSSLAQTGGVASDCVSRGDVIAEADLDAGEHFVVVDTFKENGNAGPYVLRIDAIGDEWVERPVASGVTWRARRYESLAGGRQVVHDLVVVPGTKGLSVRSLDATGCQTVAALGRASGAVAGINGGYFGAGCNPVSLLKAGGVLKGTNSTGRGSFGWTRAGAPKVALIGAGQDWPEVEEAQGGGPLLVVGGQALSGASAWAKEGMQSASFLGRNPRTYAGIDVDGWVHLGTVDGRRASAHGMSMDALAAWTASSEVGLVDGTNLDGGGSTTLWIAGATPSGVVNYPSDSAVSEPSDHSGERSVSGGLFVFADRYNHPPRFQTEPPTIATPGSVYRYDADALDLDVDDALSFALTRAPVGMKVDSATGVVTFEPTEGHPPTSEVTLVVRDPMGAEAVQSFVLRVGNGPAPQDAGGDAVTVDAPGDGRETGPGPLSDSGLDESPEPRAESPPPSHSCSVVTPRSTDAAPWGFGLLALLSLVCGRRRA